MKTKGLDEIAEAMTKLHRFFDFMDANDHKDGAVFNMVLGMMMMAAWVTNQEGGIADKAQELIDRTYDADSFLESLSPPQKKPSPLDGTTAMERVALFETTVAEAPTNAEQLSILRGFLSHFAEDEYAPVELLQAMGRLAAEHRKAEIANGAD